MLTNQKRPELLIYCLLFTLPIDEIVKLVRKKIKLKRWKDSDSPNNL